MSALVVVHPGKVAAYGAEELKLAAHRNMFTALSISILIHFCLIGCYYLNDISGKGDAPPPPGRGPVVVVNAGPRIPGIYTPPPEFDKGSLRQRGREGIPVPGPHNSDLDSQLIADQNDLREGVDPHGMPLDVDEYKLPPDIIIPDEEPPDTFVAVEKDPIIVKSALPAYPPLALNTGIEGKVYVKMWVDRQGKVREVRIIRSDNDVFNDVAVEAAKQFVFTPAYMNNGPVSVWVAFPFRFRLTAAK